MARLHALSFRPILLLPRSTGLIQGRYTFVLTVTDNHGLTDSKTVLITVNAAAAISYTAPVANPGNAQTITLPTSAVTLSGSGTGTNGATISSYSWSKTDGPSSGSIVSPNSTVTSVTGLTQGRYVFVLTVTDNRGLTDSKAVVITVNASASTAAPLANPGNAQTITLPTNTATLSGAGTNGATISSYSWVKTDGPSSGTIISPNSTVTSVTGLTQGRYVFVLTVTDYQGLTDSKAVVVTVNSSASTAAPLANPGNAQTITLPTSTATLSGAGTDGATISSYSWVKTDGPSSGTIISPNSTVTSVTGLIQGRYTFVLTVTDNRGWTDSKAVPIYVNAAMAGARVAAEQDAAALKSSKDSAAAITLKML